MGSEEKKMVPTSDGSGFPTLKGTCWSFDKGGLDEDMNEPFLVIMWLFISPIGGHCSYTPANPMEKLSVTSISIALQVRRCSDVRIFTSGCSSLCCGVCSHLNQHHRSRITYNPVPGFASIVSMAPSGL